MPISIAFLNYMLWIYVLRKKKVIYLKGGKRKQIMLRPMLEKYVLKVYVWSPRANWKYKLLAQGQKFHSWLSSAICSPNKLGREQLRIYFNVINAVITIKLSRWTQVVISSSLAATSYQNLSEVRTYSNSNTNLHTNLKKYYSSEY